MSRFLFIVFCLTVLLALACQAGQQWAGWKLPELWAEIILFNAFITGFIGYRLARVKDKQPQVFVQFYLISIIVKMVAALAFLGVIVYKRPETIQQNAILFMIAYLAFTFVEVVFLVRRNA